MSEQRLALLRTLTDSKLDENKDKNKNLLIPPSDRSSRHRPCSDIVIHPFIQSASSSIYHPIQIHSHAIHRFRLHRRLQRPRTAPKRHGSDRGLPSIVSRAPSALATACCASRRSLALPRCRPAAAPSPSISSTRGSAPSSPSPGRPLGLKSKKPASSTAILVHPEAFTRKTFMKPPADGVSKDIARGRERGDGPGGEREREKYAQRGCVYEREINVHRGVRAERKGYTQRVNVARI